MTDVGNEEAGDENSLSLSKEYDEGYKLWTSVNTSYEPTNEKPFQDMVKKAIAAFEDCTRKVSLLGLFSVNEELEEISTPDLKYLLLPTLLGDLTIRLTNEDRKQVIDAAQVYYLDFLTRCKNYAVADFQMRQDQCQQLQQAVGDLQLTQTRTRGDLIHSSRQRDEKIKRYKALKEMEKKVNEMEKLIKEGRVEDELLREYYIMLLKKWINQAQDELASIDMEKPMLAHMDRLKADGVAEDHPTVPRKAINRRPLNPVIITKDAFQKKVYGLGYPSIPALTVDEFVDQKFRDGTWQKPDTTSLYARTMAGVNEREDLEREQEDKEINTETDDPDSLQKARNWDDWKDDHRRGFGNRKNMG